MRSLYILIIFILSFSFHSYGKVTPKDKQVQLSANGIKILEETETYSDYQYDLLSSFDFNPYRNYSYNRIVQIEDGPLTELSSIKEMLQSGKEIPSELSEKKRNEVTQSAPLKSIITLINIGFRYGPKKNTETGF